MRPLWTSNSSGSTSTPAGSWSTAGGSGSSPTRTGRSIWSRWTASRTASAATRAACCALPRRRWSSRPRSQVGDEVEAGAPVLVLESMKMETVLRAPFKARLRECLVSVGSQVETGAPLLRLEPIGDDSRRPRPPQTEAVDLELPPEPAGLSAAGPGRPRHRRPAQPAARLRPRPARRAPGAVRLPGRAGRAGPPPARGRGRAAAGVRRPVRAQPQPAGRRGDQGRHPGAQPARVLPHLPAEPRRRAGRAAGHVPPPAGPGARPLRRRRLRAHARAGRGRLPDLPGAAAGLGRRRR